MKRFLFIFMAMIMVLSCGGKNESKTDGNTDKTVAEEKTKGNGNNTLDKDEIVIGMELQFPPFETITKDGKPYGISVDMAEALGKYLGKKVRIEEVAYSGLIPALTSNKIDLIISSMTITDERKEQIDFSDAYANAYLSLLIAKDSKVQTPEDLNNKDVIIAVKKGTTGQILAQKVYPDAKLVVFEKESEAVQEVSQGKADAFIYDVYSIYKNAKELPNTTRAYLKPISNEDTGSWGVGMRKNDTDLKNKVNEFLKAYAADGTREEIINKHLGEVKQTFDKEKIPFFFQ